MNGRYKNEFMITALFITLVMLTIFMLLHEKKEMLTNLRSGFVWYAVCGLANGLVNYLVLVLSTRMAASVMFPIISAGGIVVTAFIAVFGYKEKLSTHQMLGLGLGIGAIILLNL